MRIVGGKDEREWEWEKEKEYLSPQEFKKRIKEQKLLKRIKEREKKRYIEQAMSKVPTRVVFKTPFPSRPGKRISPYTIARKTAISAGRRISRGIGYGYEGMPTGTVGRPKQSYAYVIPGVGPVPINVYRKYLSRLKAQARSEQDLSQVGIVPEQAQQQIAEQAYQQRQIVSQPATNVQFSRRDFNLMRQEDQFNLLRDMEGINQDYEYMETNLISGEQQYKRKIGKLGFL